jgi:uncharacterized protein (DUF2267 family)
VTTLLSPNRRAASNVVPHNTPNFETVSLERIQDGVHREPGIDAEQVAKVMLALLAARLPPAELENAKAATPEELHGLWPS